MEVSNYVTTCGFKETWNEGMNQTGEASNEHASAKVRCLKQVLKVGLPYGLWMISKQPLNHVHQSLRLEKCSAKVRKLIAVDLCKRRSRKTVVGINF